MMLIEVFTDYVLNRKSLKEYVQYRKTTHERGEFNDTKLIQAEENLQRLKQENPELYEQMYETLSKIYKGNRGLSIEYPLDFIRQILRMYKSSLSVEEICEEYKRMLDHYHHDA
jgi:hypothetical protein